MKKASRVSRRVITAIVLIVAGSLVLGTLHVSGFWDEEKAVHIKAGEIENSTLAIGSHLIHLSALTDSLYEIANTSAEESGQGQIYYKSELGGGAWFDITSATSLADITTDGSPVTNEEMEALFFTHHTKSDKITYDLRTGEAVNIFNIRDPYDLENMEELSPLKMFYDQTIELEGENDITKRIDVIWQTPLTSEAKKEAAEGLLGGLGDILSGILGMGKPPAQDISPTGAETMDAQLEALQKYLDALTENDAPAREIEKVSGVMAAVDAGRRYEVFLLVQEALQAYMEELGGSTGETEAPAEGGEGGEAESETTEGTMTADTPPELLSALAESIGNVEASLITYGGKMLSEGMTVISNAEHGLSTALIEHAEANNHAACDGDVKNLLLLDNIQNSVISDRPGELAMLDEMLLPAAEAVYAAAVGQGESAEYRAAVANNAAQALLNRYIREYEAEVNTRRGELEFLVNARCSRLDAQGSLTFVEEMMSTATGTLATAMPKDDFMDSALKSVEDFIVFLSNLLRKLQLALGGNEMDQLTAEKEALQTQRLQALDNNDLAAAAALQEQIDAVEESIRAMEDETAARMAELQKQIDSAEDGSAEQAAAKAELANLQNGLSDGSLGALVAQLKNTALGKGGGTGSGSGTGGAGTGDGSGSALDGDGSAVDALAGLLGTAPKLVLPALQEIYNELLLKGGNQDIIDSIEQAILENPGALRDDLSAEEIRTVASEWLLEKNAQQGADSGLGSLTGAGSGSGSGAGGASGNSKPLTGVGGISRQDGQNTLAAILGLQLYYDETGNPAVQKVLAALAQEQLNLGNPLVFDRIDDGSGEYLPLTAIQALTGRRYVWNKNASLGVLAQGADYYGFTVYSDWVQRDRDGVKTEQMARSAKYQACIHVPEEYTEEQFGVFAVYLPESTLGCVCDDPTMETAQELFAWLMRTT